MSIKVWDYLEEFEDERNDIFEAIEKVLKSGRLILGESVTNFENSFSTYCGVKYGVGVDNGTNAIFLALKSLNIPIGSEVITVSNTAVPTVSAIVSAGLIPRFVDISLSTYLMDINKIEKCINKKTKCIIPVHLFGQCVDMDPLIAIAQKYNISIIEDCAQCHGAEYKGRKAGSMGDMGAFSFYPTKPLGGYGDGGMVIMNNSIYYEKLRRLRFYGMDTVYYAEEHGYNSRLDEIHAEILSKKLKNLNEYIKKRNQLAYRYSSILKNTSIELPYTPEYNRHVFYIYTCRHKDRDRIISEFKKEEIFINISYPWPIHLMRGYKFLGYKEGDLPNTEHASSEIFSLPMFPKLSFKDQNEVCKCINDILGENINL